MTNRWTILEGKARRDWMQECDDQVSAWQHYFQFEIAKGIFQNSICGLNPLERAAEPRAHAWHGFKDEATFKLLVKNVAKVRASMIEKGIPPAIIVACLKMWS
jgi:hypothetical protein